MTITSYDPRELRAESTDVATTAPVPDWVTLLVPMADLAERLATTEFVPQTMRGRPAAIVACMMYGAEIGIGPMQALRSIDVVQGKPTPSAELLRAMIYNAGHELWIVEASATRVTVGGRRYGQPREHTVTWTSEMARAAGLTGKESWKKYPRQMLLARATSELARSVFPDAIRGLGHLDDVADMPAVDTTPEDAASNVKTMRRARRRSVETAAPATGGASESSPSTDAPPSDPPEDAESVPLVAGAVTTQQLARINASLRDLEITDRDQRLAIASGVVGRKLASAKDMTTDEASALISALDDAHTLGIALPAWTDDDPPTE